MKRPAKKPVEERRNEIMDTTIEVVMERGFGATRVQDVAKRLGVSTGLIHYHFDSKDALLSAAFEHAAQRDLERLAHEVNIEASATERLERTILLYAPEAAETGWVLWIDAWGEALRSPTLRQISQDLDVAWKNHLEAVVRAGVTSGEFTCDDPHAAAWRLAALLDGLGVQVTVHEHVISRDDLRDWVLHAASLELGIPESAFTSRKRRRKPAVMRRR